MARLFVAIYPPPEVARSLLDAALGQDVERPLGWRAVPAEQVHLTLQFVGEVDPRQFDEVAESVMRSASGLRRFRLAASEIGHLPERGPPRLLAAFTDSPPEVLELHRRLVVRLARSVKEKSRDRFTPHLTLIRFGAVPTERPGRRAIGPIAWEVGEIRLMRSVLKPSGAEHVEMGWAALEPG